MYKSAQELIDWDTLPEVPALKTKIRNNLSLAFFLVQDFETCINWAQASLEFDKQNFKAHLRMANSYVRLKLPQKARVSVDELARYKLPSLKNDIQRLRKRIKNLEEVEAKVNKKILAKTAKKIKMALDKCECNDCLIGDFENRFIKLLKKDKEEYRKFNKKVIRFRNYFQNLLKQESSKLDHNRQKFTETSGRRKSAHHP